MIEYSVPWRNADSCSSWLADLVTKALIDEAELTPKPGLVDMETVGAHTDLTIDLMRLSAKALNRTFAEMARVAFRNKPNQELREQLARIGREGEEVMLEATGGTNTHRGAIWALGLLIAAAAITGPHTTPKEIATLAGKIARYPDRFAPVKSTNGTRVRQTYMVSGAIGEAHQGFPNVINIGLPALQSSRDRGIPESKARLDALLAIIAGLDDTCLLHRGGMEALHFAKQGARHVLVLGGTSTEEGEVALQQLDTGLIARNASPGGSADLLAATLFLDHFLRD
ncbi:triphosphoribosyl-dephospho-CoA synthase [uncultured Brevibacillus sp.]|uniref:triphosphoribosyl-dephospho-CoA synthase n=1 Tax=uncultured Brevibacillus sp. TaxID=169970 RepID=UPI002596CCFB|nr:triphosphoribosyl-dephospho-CoA synthase [uncultured Brevibacillus sp.]